MFSYQDQVALTILSGHGGKGSLSFHRTKGEPRGGPDGGNGGDGGDVYFSPNSRFKDLSHFKTKKRFKAYDGKSGENQNKSGARGKDIEIGVPLGTVVREQDNSLLYDLTDAKSVCFLTGGKGGKGNAFFKTSLNQAPRHFQKGIPETEKKVILEFKPLADVALIGKPNAGKSTFLNSITRATSPVASYPYTTLVPYLGKVEQDSFLVVDIPGLARGASEKITRGLSFLRLIQRAKVLLHFIDVASIDPEQDKQEVEAELENFDKKFSEKHFVDLSKKKRFLILSKSDQITSKDMQELKQKLNPKKQIKEFSISCTENKGIEELLSAIKKEIFS